MFVKENRDRKKKKKIDNVITFTVKVKENVKCLFCLLAHKCVCCQHLVSTSSSCARKTWSAFSCSRGNTDFLTLSFSIRVRPIISFRFLFLLKTVIGCSWNNSRRFLLVWRMFQFLRTTAVRFGKNRLCVNINGMRFGSCCSWSFSCSRSTLTSLSTFSKLLICKFLVVTLPQKSFFQFSCVMVKIFVGWAGFLYSKCFALWDAFFNDFGCSELLRRFGGVFSI